MVLNSIQGNAAMVVNDTVDEKNRVPTVSTVSLVEYRKNDSRRGMCVRIYLRQEVVTSKLARIDC